MTKRKLKIDRYFIILPSMQPINPHNFPKNEILRSILETDLATVYFYVNVVVVEANEGVTMSYKTGYKILSRGLKIFGRRPFVYIAHRVNSYSVIPTDFKHLVSIPTLKGIAIASKQEAGRANAELEKSFSKKPLEVFENIEEAYEWGLTCLDK